MTQLTTFALFSLFASLTVWATAVVLREPSRTATLLFAVAAGALLALTAGVHFVRLAAAGSGWWNATGPRSLSEGRWHDLLFTRILFWALLLSFGVLVLALLDVVSAVCALLVLASFGVPVGVVWVASALRFDAASVKQTKLG